MDIDNKYGTLKIQKSILPLLKSFHDYCKGNEINYSLAYGSLLGAVRHKGFIPWDDDVDVILLRSEFDKLKEKIENSDLILEYRTIESLWLPRVKFRNQDTLESKQTLIDVFILDNVPQSRLMSIIKLYSILMIQGMLKEKPPVKNMSILWKFLSVGCWLLGRVISKQVLYNLYDKIAQAGNKNSDFLQSYNTIWPYRHHKVSSKVLSSYLVAPFEDIEVSIMCGYDEFLKTLYGDYMTPPEDKKPKHS